jgi:hypothetical protein
MMPINKEFILTKLGSVGRSILVAMVLVVLYMTITSIKNYRDTNQNIRQKSVCPALLSISRSARDTLIVMKAEQLCNEYVLDNLK